VGPRGRRHHRPEDQRSDQLTPSTPGAAAPAGPIATGAPGFRTSPTLALAPWSRRAYAFAIDLGIVLVGEAIAIGIIAIAGLHGIGGLVLKIALIAAPVLFHCWQAVVRQAAIGKTIGKSVAGISLVDDADGLSPTERTCFRRLLAHLLDLVSLVGFFRPLWQPERKTFADTLTATRVIEGDPILPPPEEMKTVPLRHPGRWAAAVVVFIVIGMLVHAVVTNHKFRWDIVGKNMTTSVVLDGLLVTLELTAIAMAIGIALGIVLAVMRLSPNPIVSGAAWSYIWVFRGTPVLVQLIIWFNIAAVFPRVSLGVPFGHEFFGGSSNTIITSFFAAILGLGLNEAAYMSEIVRAGVLSVDQGQTEAAQALGMNRLRIMRRIVLPQAMRVIVPPTGNETISMLKTTSLVIVISLGDLLYSVQSIYSRTYQTIPNLIVASLWYLIITSILSGGQFYVERYYNRGSSRQLPPTPLARIFRSKLKFHAVANRDGSRAGA
jgi:polar amino acid transport system permease protein